MERKPISWDDLTNKITIWFALLLGVPSDIASYSLELRKKREPTLEEKGFLLRPSVLIGRENIHAMKESDWDEIRVELGLPLKRQRS